jgi:hypothetical protein
MNDEMEMARLLGARQAFGLVAGRCSAADATILRDIRETKRYLSFSPTWQEFCDKHLHLSKTHANYLIRLLNDFGPNYFALAQLTRITPDEFRKIRALVTDNGLEYGGQAIALIEKNTDRLTEAVSSLRQKETLPLKPLEPWARKLEQVERRLFQSLRQLERLRQDMKATADAGKVLYTLRCEIDKIMETWVGG